MNIKNIKAFIAAAAVIVSSVSIEAHDAVPRYQYMKDRGDVNNMPMFRTTNLYGELVKVVPSASFHPAEIAQYAPNKSAHFSLVDHYQGQRACTVFLDHEALANPSLSSTSNLYNLVDRQAYLYSIIAHEMSHCLGITPEEGIVFASKVLNNDPGLRGYDEQIDSLNRSFKEVHADLTAILLGASKTGDWSVLDRHVIADRTQSFNPQHASLLAVVDLLDGLNPQKLQGRSFEQVMTVANTLFKYGAYDASGQLSIHSPVASNIMREWYASGLETKTYVRLYAPKDTANQMIQERVELYRQFAERAIGKESLKDRTAISRLYGLKAYSLQTQNQILVNNNMQHDARGASLMKINQSRISNLDFIIKGADHLHYGAPASIAAQRNAMGQWIAQYSNPQSSRILERELPSVMSNALMPNNNADYNTRIGTAQTSIRTRLSEALKADKIENGQASYNNIGVNFEDNKAPSKMDKFRDAIPNLFNR